MGLNPEGMSSGPTRSYAGLRPARLIIAVAAIVAVGLLAWAVRMGLASYAHGLTRTGFSLVAMALRNYSDSRGRLPDLEVWRATTCLPDQSGTSNVPVHPLYSWRVDIVPYLLGWHGAWDPSRAWDDPANKQLIELSSYYAYGVTGTKPYPTTFPETNILAITGPGTAFGDGKGPPLALKDVPPQTIIAVETRSSGIPWPAPGDLDIRTMPRTINAADGKGISSRHGGGFHVIFAGGWVWLLSDNVPFETLRKFFTIADAKEQDREKLLGPFALRRGL